MAKNRQDMEYCTLSGNCVSVYEYRTKTEYIINFVLAIISTLCSIFSITAILRMPVARIMYIISGNIITYDTKIRVIDYFAEVLRAISEFDKDNLGAENILIMAAFCIITMLAITIIAYSVIGIFSSFKNFKERGAVYNNVIFLYMAVFIENILMQYIFSLEYWDFHVKMASGTLLIQWLLTGLFGIFLAARIVIQFERINPVHRKKSIPGILSETIYMILIFGISAGGLYLLESKCRIMTFVYHCITGEYSGIVDLPNLLKSYNMLTGEYYYEAYGWIKISFIIISIFAVIDFIVFSLLLVTALKNREKRYTKILTLSIISIMASIVEIIIIQQSNFKTAVCINVSGPFAVKAVLSFLLLALSIIRIVTYNRFDKLRCVPMQ